MVIGRWEKEIRKFEIGGGVKRMIIFITTQKTDIFSIVKGVSEFSYP